MNLTNLFWLFLLLSTLYPAFKMYMIEKARIRLMRRMEKKHGSRVISMIHRQEMFSFLGIPFSRFITIEDSEQILRVIRLTPENQKIDIILHTPGGLVLAAEQIAHAIERHPARVTVYVPHYAMSGGALIALAADEIVMDSNAVLGPVDPQVGKYPAASIINAVGRKDVNEVDDDTLILADISQKALNQVKEAVERILKSKMPEEKARGLATDLTQGRWTHDYPITYGQLAEMGLAVSTDLPEEVYRLMELYPQPGRGRPSVQYVPMPPDNEEKRRS
ncbi:MAG: SDH family Clp fold serine proteinase [Bacillota bacterium]